MAGHGHPSPMRCALLALALLLASAPVHAQESVDDFRVKMEKWVQSRQLVSEEKSEWEAEKQLLRATRDLLRDEREDLQAEIQELEETNTQVDEERRDLLLRRGEYQRLSRALEAEVVRMEARVREIQPRLPTPLQRRLEPLLVQIPDDPEKATQPLGQRLMNVLGVLAQAEKFNGTATFIGETREIADGQQVQVRTLYWGLGQAFYVDAMGETAGVGRPGTEGWTFSNEPDLADDAGLLLDIYEGNVDTIEFVSLPVAIQ